jgi:DNA-binding response OmpR family regulator
MLPLLIGRGRFVRTDTCGALCSEQYGHHAETHDRAGREALYAELAARRSGQVRTGLLVVDFDTDRVTIAGAEPPLTPMERDVLGYLAAHLGAPCRHYDLIEAVWDTATAEAWTGGQRPSHTLRVVLSRLRVKLGAAGDLLETVIGRGYRLRRVSFTEGDCHVD